MKPEAAKLSCMWPAGLTSWRALIRTALETGESITHCIASTRVALMLLLFMVAGITSAAERPISRVEAERQYQLGHSAYQKQDYQAAYDAYRQVVAGGFESGDIFYNLGNAAARLNKTGEAVLYYSRARDLNPRDPDIRFNLRKIEPPQNRRDTFVLLVPLISVWNALSLREWLAAFFIVFVLLGIVGAAYLMRRAGTGKSLLKPVFLVLAGLTLLIGAFAGTTYFRQQFVHYAVVMPGETAVYSGPGEGFTRLITVPEGTRVRRMSFKDPAWARVHLIDGREGFVPAGNLQTI